MQPVASGKATNPKLSLIVLKPGTPSWIRTYNQQILSLSALPISVQGQIKTQYKINHFLWSLTADIIPRARPYPLQLDVSNLSRR